MNTEIKPTVRGISIVKHYVLGFAIDIDGESVLVIKKKRPKWQEGAYNGIGGHIEPGETALAAMVREFEEETGIKTEARNWERFATIKGNNWDCEVFKSFTVIIQDAETKTDEEVEIVNIPALMYEPVVSNLLWLVHMACDTNYTSSDNTYFAEINYK